MSGNADSKTMMLVCGGGPDRGQRIAVTEQPAAIGRASACELASNDPEVAERHVFVRLDGGKASFKVFDGCAAFVDGQRVPQGRLEPRQQLRIGRSLWQVETGVGGDDISSFLSNIGGRISDVAGLEKIEGFSPGAMFSEVWRKRTDEEMEQYFAVGTPSTTPPLNEVDTNWPKPWLFLKTFILAAIVYAGFVFAYNTFNNVLVLPGMLTIGAFVIPFSLIIFFLEMNVLRNVPLYQVLKLVFLGGILSVLLSLLLYQWTKLDSWMGAVGVGLIEESGKAAALLLVINKLKYRWTLNGMLFGAAIGAGFAAFESAGYAYSIGVDMGNNAMLHSITKRGVLSVCGGHVLWAALVGGALWRVRGDERFRWEMLKDARFLRVFALCAGMHAIWDSPFSLPFYLKYIALGFVAWVALLSLIQSGLRQIRAAQTAGATEYFKQQKLAESAAAKP
jgi:protease PrsW